VPYQCHRTAVPPLPSVCGTADGSSGPWAPHGTCTARSAHQSPGRRGRRWARSSPSAPHDHLGAPRLLRPDPTRPDPTRPGPALPGLAQIDLGAGGGTGGSPRHLSAPRRCLRAPGPGSARALVTGRPRRLPRQTGGASGARAGVLAPALSDRPVLTPGCRPGVDALTERTPPWPALPAQAEGGAPASRPLTARRVTCPATADRPGHTAQAPSARPTTHDEPLPGGRGPSWTRSAGLSCARSARRSTRRAAHRW